MNKTDEKIIDIGDVLLELFRKKKTLLLITLLSTFLVAGVGTLKSVWEEQSEAEIMVMSSDELEDIYELKLKEARDLLTSDEAMEVERLNDQLKSYIEYREQYQKDFSSYLNTSEEMAEDSVIKRVSYSFTSSLEGAENLMSVMSLGIDDYQKIMEIL
ncbi:MAG: hypothetical protein Q4D81_08030, partial [Eubacteriales bacterium]|nr:hypothetical protein [Eubacteriales bacterium]